MSDLSHGNVGKHEQNFTALLPLRVNSYNPHDLLILSEQMKADVDSVKDGPDPEENILVPAGYTYFGQFIDRDLTFDSTSSLDPTSGSLPSNLRTPRFDLDCLYGDGPDAQPYMFDGAKLLFKDKLESGEPQGLANVDLMRNSLGRAIIGDKRNDENSIVSQIQWSFVKYHNKVVDALLLLNEESWNTPHKLFESARNEVRWTYQNLVIKDFLKRIVKAEVFANLKDRHPNQRMHHYAFYTEDKRGNLPREFVAAVYRFGHSGVRTGYRMNDGMGNRFNIFPASDDVTKLAGAMSLLGFDPITNNQVIDNWERFFPESLPLELNHEDRSKAADEVERTFVRLQFAYKIDPTLVDPLGALPVKQIAGEDTTAQAGVKIAPEHLPYTPNSSPEAIPTRPSLALLNLLRGDSYGIQGGQAFAKTLKEKGFPCETLRAHELVTREAFKKEDETFFRFKEIPKDLQHDTPLWFYILAEAQAPLVHVLGGNDGKSEFAETRLLTGNGAKTQLGWVGGRIVAEVFYGLLDSDVESYVNAAPRGWKPMLGGNQDIIFRNLLKFADPSNS